MKTLETSIGRRDWFPVAAVLFGSIFAALTILTGLFFVNWASILDILFFMGFELLFVSVAYDLTESILALLLPPLDLPSKYPLTEFPRVALLIAVCDDVIPEILERLQNQTYPELDIYVLDDSSTKHYQNLAEQSGYLVLRRGTRRAYKAGNLNNWLDRYGALYKYFVILDSDSMVGDDFVTQMVEYAEHPENQSVAVLQSKILSWNNAATFPRVLGSMAALRLHVLERVANRTNMMLSWGHNSLHRTDSILRVGGFHENITAEDTALSFMLSAQGYTVNLVDVLSHDTEPQSMFHYMRRITRWAAQTVEVFRLPWRCAASRLKLLACYQLHGYFVYSVYLTLLLLAAWAPSKTIQWSIHDSMTLIINSQLYLTPWFGALLAFTGLWGMQFLLRFVLARRARVPIRSFLLHGLLSVSLTLPVSVVVGWAMLRTALGVRAKFVPTNAGTSGTPVLGSIMKSMTMPTIYMGFVLAGLLFRNRYLLYGLNSLWLFLWLAAPLVLWLFHAGETEVRGRANEP